MLFSHLNVKWPLCQGSDPGILRTLPALGNLSPSSVFISIFHSQSNGVMDGEIGGKKYKLKMQIFGTAQKCKTNSQLVGQQIQLKIQGREGDLKSS